MSRAASISWKIGIQKETATVAVLCAVTAVAAVAYWRSRERDRSTNAPIASSPASTSSASSSAKRRAAGDALKPFSEIPVVVAVADERRWRTENHYYLDELFRAHGDTILVKRAAECDSQIWTRDPDAFRSLTMGARAWTKRDCRLEGGGSTGVREQPDPAHVSVHLFPDGGRTLEATPSRHESPVFGAPRVHRVGAARHGPLRARHAQRDWRRRRRLDAAHARLVSATYLSRVRGCRRRRHYCRAVGATPACRRLFCQVLRETMASSSKGSFAPFSFGARKCPGGPITLAISKIIMVFLLRDFELAPVDDAPDQESRVQKFVTCYSQGTPVRLKRRTTRSKNITFIHLQQMLERAAATETAKTHAINFFLLTFVFVFLLAISWSFYII